MHTTKHPHITTSILQVYTQYTDTHFFVLYAYALCAAEASYLSRASATKTSGTCGTQKTCRYDRAQASLGQAAALFQNEIAQTQRWHSCEDRGR